MLNTLAPELAQNRDVLTSVRLPALRHVITIGNWVHAGCTPFAAVCDLADPDAMQRLDAVAATIDPTRRSTSSSRAERRVCPKVQPFRNHNLINNGFLRW